MASVLDKIADRLLDNVSAAAAKLAAMTDREAGVRPAPLKWCAKEVLGHLLDSASNNNQRFVRAQLADELTFPGYEQERWVAAQGYAEAPWGELVELWRLANRRLAAVMRHIPAEKLSVPCRIGSGNPITLGWIVEDYLRHLEHHLEQIPAARGGILDSNKEK